MRNRKGEYIMTQLDCTVSSCMYNKDNYCSKGDIVIGGRSASCNSETSCESFRERNGQGACNSTGHASAVVDVDCEAEKCRYNNNCKCSAGHIGISGGQACSCKETECASFTCK